MEEEEKNIIKQYFPKLSDTDKVESIEEMDSGTKVKLRIKTDFDDFFELHLIKQKRANNSEYYILISDEKKQVVGTRFEKSLLDDFENNFQTIKTKMLRESPHVANCPNELMIMYKNMDSTHGTDDADEIPKFLKEKN